VLKVFPALETQLYKDFPENFDSGLWKKPLVGCLCKKWGLQAKDTAFGGRAFFYSPQNTIQYMKLQSQAGKNLLI
jgi:hypothetical protein